MPATRTSSRFQPLRNPSLRRLKTAFSTSSSNVTAAPTPSNTPPSNTPASASIVSPVPIYPPASHQPHANAATSPSLSAIASSPLSRASSPSSDLTSLSLPSSTFSSISKASRFRALIMLRRKPSVADIEMEEERRSFGIELAMLEPRPVGQGLGASGVVFGGIEDILNGRSY